MIPATIRNAFFYAIVVALGGFVFGLDAALISGTVNFISSEWNLTDMQIGTVVSAPGLGVLFALMIAGYGCDKFGRKKSLIFIAALYLISAVWSALATSYMMLVAARFLGGLAFTSLTLAAMYIGEIAPPKWRGKLVSMNQINIVVGLTAAYFINYAILKASQSDASWTQSLGFHDAPWRWMLGSEILPALIWLILLFFVPESPRWLVFNNRSDQARKVLAKVLPANEIEEQVADIENSMHHAHDSRSIGAQLRELFSPRMRLALLVGAAIAIAQQTTGINAVLYYAPTVFEQLGIGTDSAFMQTIWVGLTSIVATVSSLFFIDRFGRRPMVIGGLIWVITSLAICSYGFHKARYQLTDTHLTGLTEVMETAPLQPLVGKTYASDAEFKAALNQTIGETKTREHGSLLIQKAAVINATLILLGIMSFIAAFQFSVGPIMWVLFSEIFPISVRGVAIPIFAFVTSIVSYLVTQFFPWQLATLGASSTFLSYAVMCSVGLVALHRWLPETKNRTIEEVELVFEEIFLKKNKS